MHSSNRFASRIDNAHYELETGRTTWARASAANETVTDNEKGGINQSLVASKLKAMRLKNSSNEPTMVSVANLRRGPKKIGMDESFSATYRSG